MVVLSPVGNVSARSHARSRVGMYCTRGIRKLEPVQGLGRCRSFRRDRCCSIVAAKRRVEDSISIILNAPIRFDDSCSDRSLEARSSACSPFVIIQERRLTISEGGVNSSLLLCHFSLRTRVRHDKQMLPGDSSLGVPAGSRDFPLQYHDSEFPESLQR